MSAVVKPLKERILEELQRKPGLKAAELAQVLGCERREVNRCLSYDLAGRVQQGSDYRWRLVQRGAPQAVAAPTPTTEIARLCRYYLECISQDMDEGVSVFARNQYGDPDYAQLGSVPIASDTDWWNAPGVSRLLGKVRADRGKTILWFGYPVRLRQHRTARWEGFFVEPVLMWPVLLPDVNGDAPRIDEQMPVVNAKFLRSMAMGDGMQLAEEAARLSDELGLGVPAGDLPEVDELVERLLRIRPDWDWQETLDPSACADTPPLAEISVAGVYNRAVIIPGERSPYTQGLETELKALGDVPMERLKATSLGRWLAADTSPPSLSAPDSDPLIEVVPMNTEQRTAVRAALTVPHSVVTGPPGTGKSQVVTNMLVNAAWRGLKVLFASKNNKAVDVVEARVNGLGNRPVLLRMGSRDYQARLAGYLTQMLAGNPGAEVQANYGDPMQLRHISALTRPRDSELQYKHGLVETRVGWMYSVSSLFDIAASVVPPESIINLRDHHRSHADIIGFSNDAFYEGHLRVATRYKQLKRPSATQPGIVWQDVSGSATRPREGGALNAEEARAVVDALVDLLVTRGYAGTVGVVTPFRAQAQLLQLMLQSRPELQAVAVRAELLVDTVHKFQGDERDVMFFSPVVSRGISAGALGFLRSNGNLFNVAITRARGLLHVVGDRTVAAACGVDYLEQFVSYVSGLDAARRTKIEAGPATVGREYPTVTHPERVSEWERVLYRAMVAAGLKPIPQFSVEQYDLDFSLIENGRKLAIEVDGERYHRSWTGELCLRDQLRNQRLIELGWDVQRFWVYEVRDDLDRCVRRVLDWADRARESGRAA